MPIRIAAKLQMNFAVEKVAPEKEIQYKPGETTTLTRKKRNVIRTSQKQEIPQKSLLSARLPWSAVLYFCSWVSESSAEIRKTGRRTAKMTKIKKFLTAVLYSGASVQCFSHRSIAEEYTTPLPLMQQPGFHGRIRGAGSK